MVKSKKKISKKDKEQILAASMEAGCVIAELARTWGVEKSTLYKWRSQLRMKDLELGVNEADNKFVELSVKKASNDKSYNLAEASLIYGEYSILIKGRISNDKLISIIKIMEGQC